MLIIIGSYRGKRYLKKALRSIETNLIGDKEIVIVDDSPNASDRAWIDTLGFEVIHLFGAGYGSAMREVCKRAGNAAFMFWEEDFTLTEQVQIAELESVLERVPHLAQIALLRQAWFPNEVEAGGLIEALEARGEEIIRDPSGVIRQRATFTCNPALWRAGIAVSGWPAGKWSEDKKRDELIANGYWFGFLPGVRVRHEGVRSGHGY